MRQNLRGESHGDTLHSLCQQQREFHRKRDRFLVAAVVGSLPFGGFRIEHHVEGEFRQTGFDVTGSRRAVARQDVSPVPLAIDEQVLLSQLYQRVADGRVAVRVELHGMPHDVGHLVVASVVQPFHGVQDASLYRFQTVVDVGHGTFQDNVRSVVQKPVLVHTAQLVLHRLVFLVDRLIVRMFFFFRDRMFVFVKCIFAHR